MNATPPKRTQQGYPHSSLTAALWTWVNPSSFAVVNRVGTLELLLNIHHFPALHLSPSLFGTRWANPDHSDGGETGD
ncbi:hypothetical protein GJAV_G00170700 [Gymnothorax javanicus]|nr:hypothetical protein GJAV_G00170700 [Gymnothorax javanicus]